MKIYFLLLIVLTLFFSFCSQKTSLVKKTATKQSYETKYEDKMSFDYCTATIKQGLYGCCTKRTGNTTPTTQTNPCKWVAVKRTIFIYEETSMKQATLHGNWCSEIKTKLVAQTESDGNGCYQLELPVGMYSVFVFEDDKYYFLRKSNNSILNPLTVDSNNVTKRNLIISSGKF